MQLRSVAAAVATLALAVGAVACGGDDSGSGGGEDSGGLSGNIKVGVPLDTSGSAAIAGVGNQEKAGVELAAEEVNNSGFLGDAKLELVMRDTKADKQEAVKTVRELIQRDKVNAIVGFTLTPSFLASGPVAQQQEIPTMTVGLSADGVTEVGDYIFRIYPSLSRLFSKSDPEFLKAIGAKTAAFLYGNDTETTVGQFKARQEIVKQLGIKSVEVQTVTAQDTDVRAQLTQIKNADPDVLFLNVNSGQQPGILVQAREIGLLPGVPLIGDVGFGGEAVREQAAESLQCAMFATTYTPKSDAGRNPEFVDLYAKKYQGKTADDFGAWGYDAIWAMARAVKQAGSTDPAAVRDALASLKVSGALGEYSWDKDRQPTQSGQMMQVVDGELQPWTPDSTCEA
jgi:branched-chain amino acid transport system substrate-binding protein